MCLLNDVFLLLEKKNHGEIIHTGYFFKNILVLDSSGQPKPGFVYGNNFWLGLKTQCLDLDNHKEHAVSPENIKNNSIYRNVNEEYPPFKVNYFAAHFHHNSTLQYHVGMPNDVILLFKK